MHPWLHRPNNRSDLQLTDVLTKTSNRYPPTDDKIRFRDRKTALLFLPRSRRRCFSLGVDVVEENPGNSFGARFIVEEVQWFGPSLDFVALLSCVPALYWLTQHD